MNNDHECVNKVNKYLQNWIYLDNEIKKNNIISSELYDKKRETESKINKYYLKINNKKSKNNFQINDTQIQIHSSNINKALSLKHLKRNIDNYFNTTKNIDKDSLYKFLLKNRESYDKLIIKKIVNT